MEHPQIKVTAAVYDLAGCLLEDIRYTHLATPPKRCPQTPGASQVALAIFDMGGGCAFNFRQV